MILKLTNNKNTYSFEVEDLNNGEKLFYHFQIPTADMEDGKYNMVLLDGDEIVAEEQVCIGAFNPQTIQYSRGENVYINAPYEGNLEDVKEVEITAINTTVLPSEGYDGVKVVEVNAQPIYDEGYNEGENIGYNSGYTAGDIDGYNRGYNEGETDQKAKLSAITITENGTYSREDGYNEITVDVIDLNGDYNEGYDAGKIDGYDSGYTAGIDYASENAGEIAAANAIVLDATENKTYYTKYADDIPEPEFITGEFEDGTPFYGYAELNNISYDTGFMSDNDTKVELWWCGDVTQSDNGIIGWQGDGNFKVCAVNNVNLTNSLNAEINYKGANKQNLESYVWYHIELSKQEGFKINGELIGTFERAGDVKNLPIYLNTVKGVDYANGSFGMIKINDTIIIPTPYGFLNTNTNEMLSVAYTAVGGRYVYKNQEIIPIDNLIKQVNVNVKINPQEAGVKLQGSTFAVIPEWVDLEGVTDLGGMFSQCTNLTELPILDVPYCMNFEGMFSNIPFTDLTNIQYWVYPKNANWSLTFEQNTSVKKCSAIYMEGNNNYYQGSPLWVYSDMNNFTDFGGFIGLKYSITKDYIFTKMPNLSYESCINVLNGLYDFTGNGETPNSYQGQLKVHQNFLTTVGDEINIATAKGWIVSA